MGFFAELKRRNVVRVGLAYILIAWVLLQAADFGLDLVDAPNWVIQSLTVLVVIGLPAALLFAWIYEMTPEGLRREKDIDRSQSITGDTGRKLDRTIIVVLVIAVGFLLVERAPREREAEPGAGNVSEQAGKPPADIEAAQKSIAVLPFIAMSNGPDDEFFADGLTEEILNSLSQLPELLVTARTSAFQFKGQDLPVGEIAASLGVAHVVEGSVRRSGDRLRVTAQLIRAEDGFHLWSENYDGITQDAITVQEDIAEKIADALDVILDEEKRRAIRNAGIRDVEAFISYQKGREWYSRAHGSEDILGDLRQANEYFDRALERVPDFSLAYLFHSDYYTHILLENAQGQRIEGVSETDVVEAMDRALADFDSAARHAPNSAMRANAEFDLAMLRGEWRDLSRRLDLLLETGSCFSPVWLSMMGWAEGQATRFVERYGEDLECDPLSTTALVNQSGAAVWTGDAQLAFERASAALEHQDHDWIAAWMIRALIMGGQLEEAGTAANIKVRGDSEHQSIQVLVAAAQNDRDGARQLAAEWQETFGPSDYVGVLFGAWQGDRDEANRHAAAMDARPLGHLALLITTYWCACGAPFDLSATPNFAAKLQDSGFAWPPKSLMRLPLKDW